MDPNEALASEPTCPEKEAAAEWLSGMLINGPVTAKELKFEAAAAGMSWRTVERAKAQLGVRSRKREFQGEWVWELQ